MMSVDAVVFDMDGVLIDSAAHHRAPDRCLVFEDSLVGVIAAPSAGMRVIGVTTAHTELELLGAGAERAIPSFEVIDWPLSPPAGRAR